ncbi:MAG TPA: hypothetical protein VG839_00140 [Asticcacaulis sp.]|nr:hypothetical protein [Asticcacaulis sp.]
MTLAICAAILAMAGSAPAFAVTNQGKAPKTQTSDFNEVTPLTGNQSYIPDPSITFPKSQSKVFQFDLKGKWGLKFDVNQPEARPSGFNDIDAGAFYKLTPSVRVGGTLGFGEKTEAFKPDPNPAKSLANTSNPRVRLETTFKF